jgi:predicted nucleotidyltransferase
VVASRSKVATVCAALNEAGAQFVLAGAQAGILRGHVRATRDIDLLIEPTEANAQRVLDALSSIGFILVRDLDAREVATSHVTVIGDLWNVDLFTRAWNVRYEEAAADATVVVVDGVPIPTMSIRHLIESKRTGRLQDAADIEELERILELRGE